MTPQGGTCRGVAWLSSARAVRCQVKSFNERNPCPYLPAGHAGDYRGTAGAKPEEGGDDVKSSWPLCPGLQTCYNGDHKVLRNREMEPIIKGRLSSDSRLKPACLKSESLVIAGQPYRGEYVPEPCTHRPSSHESWGRPKPLLLTRKGSRCPR